MMLREQSLANGAAVSTETLPDVQLLMREMAHRISNEFTSAISMVTITATRCASPETREALFGVRDYLEHYALVHRALCMPEPGILIDCSDHLQQLCRSMSRSKLDARNVELLFIDHRLVMPSERCWILAMIVYELITNSARHAFDQAGGKIRVELLARNGVAQCVVSDNGGRSGNGRLRGGLEIVRLLAESLQGGIEQKFESRGSVSVVSIPIEVG